MVAPPVLCSRVSDHVQLERRSPQHERARAHSSRGPVRDLRALCRRASVIDGQPGMSASRFHHTNLMPACGPWAPHANAHVQVPSATAKDRPRPIRRLRDVLVR